MANVHNTAMSHFLAFLLFALSAKFVSKTVSCPDVETRLQINPCVHLNQYVRIPALIHYCPMGLPLPIFRNKISMEFVKPINCA